MPIGATARGLSIRQPYAGLRRLGSKMTAHFTQWAALG